MKIVMEKNRTRQEIREALQEVYEQVAEAAADALMFDFEAESLEVEDYLAFDRDGVWVGASSTRRTSSGGRRSFGRRSSRRTGAMRTSKRP